jgi:hypothetical protein
MSAFVHGADYAVLQHLADAFPGDDDQHRTAAPVLSVENLSWLPSLSRRTPPPTIAT